MLAEIVNNMFQKWDINHRNHNFGGIAGKGK
jgi:hypothetical protein